MKKFYFTPPNLRAIIFALLCLNTLAAMLYAQEKTFCIVPWQLNTSQLMLVLFRLHFVEEPPPLASAKVGNLRLVQAKNNFA